MELKQALDLAALRREHDELLREKLMVRQMQTVSNRIGALYALCATLGESSEFLDDYLSAAAVAGIDAPRPDWLLMDYSDLVSAEAERSGRFGHDLKNRLAEGREGGSLQPGLPEDVETTSEGGILFPEGWNFSEFLEAPADSPVSRQHVSWLAFLVRLHGMGKSIRVQRTEEGFEGVFRAASPDSGQSAAVWIERFCER